MDALFQEQNYAHISYSLYYSVFVHQFKLGFGHPAIDACAICANYKLKMKDPHMKDKERKTEAAMFILHRRRAWIFSNMLGIFEKQSLTLCFDMMQYLGLPRTQVGQAYSSRQLYMYVFGVVVHYGKDCAQTKDDFHLYVWMENENKRDSNMISSALDDCLRIRMNGEARTDNRLRLFSDSCFGQNKKMNVIFILQALRKKRLPNLSVEYEFPIRGHSFLPADRVLVALSSRFVKGTVYYTRRSITNYYGNMEMFTSMILADRLLTSNRKPKLY